MHDTCQYHDEIKRNKINNHDNYTTTSFDKNCHAFCKNMVNIARYSMISISAEIVTFAVFALKDSHADGGQNRRNLTTKHVPCQIVCVWICCEKLWI
jgi:hypothetical protein